MLNGQMERGDHLATFWAARFMQNSEGVTNPPSRGSVVLHTHAEAQSRQCRLSRARNWRVLEELSMGWYLESWISWLCACHGGLCWTGNKPGDSAVPRGCPRDFRTSSLMIPTAMADWNGGCCCGSVREEDLEIPLSRRGTFCEWIQADARYGVGSWDQEMSKVETRCLGPCSVEVTVQSGQQSSASSKRASFPPVPTPSVFIKTNKCGVETGEFDARERGTL